MAILRIDAYKTIGFAAITGAFGVVGTPLEHNWRAFRIVNATDGDMIFSLDGTTNNLFVPANTFVLYDISTNSAPLNNIDRLVFGINSQFYVKQSTAATTGSIYIEGIYSRGE